MKIRTLTIALAAALATLPRVAAQTPAPVPTITNISPAQATVGCCSYAGGDLGIGYKVDITLTGTNFLVQGPVYLTVQHRETGTPISSTVYSAETTNTTITASIEDTQVPAGVYDVIVHSYSTSPEVQSNPIEFTFNPTPHHDTASLEVVAGRPISQQLGVSGGTGPFTWSAPETLNGLQLSPSGLLTGTLTTLGYFSIYVTATDALGVPAISSYGEGEGELISINVVPPPPVIASPTNLPVAYVGESYRFAFTATGGTPPIYWSNEGGVPGLTFNWETAVLSGTPTEAGEFPIWIGVYSSYGGGDERTFILRVVDRPPLTFASAELPAATAGQSYTYRFVADGGTPPYRFSGKMPAGFELSASGLLTGTPASQGTLTLIVDVTDSRGETANQTFVLTVQPPQFRITTAVLANVRLGQTYAETLLSTGGTAPITWSIKTGSLPAGIVLDPATGKITGSPTKGGLARMEFQATDSKGLTATRPLTILVVVPMIEITTQSLPAGYLSQPYTAHLAADGGEPPISWSVTQGSLPDGLSLEPAGTITGTPAAKGAFAFTATATDPSGQKASRAYQITVGNPQLNITTASLSSARTGASYNYAVAAEGGSGHYVWSVAAGSLPPGLSLDTGTGAITGTPGLPGEHNIIIEVKDEAGASAERSYVISVAPPLIAATVSAEVAGAGQQGQAGVTIAKYPVEVTGRLNMTFTPDSGYSDDPAAQFASGGRTAPITIAAGATNYFVPIQVGTTPGVIRITATFTAAGADVTPSPIPERTIRIERTAPVISSVRVTRTSSGFEVTVTGFATARDITSATFRLAASGSGTLQGAEFTVQVGQAFSAWFASDAARQFGGQFTYTQPFTVQGDTSAITSVTVTLTSSSGASQAVTANF